MLDTNVCVDILRGRAPGLVERMRRFGIENKASVVLMNPPFPHEKTDKPSEAFVDRALEGLL